jgi:hypothetical protein
VPTRTNSYHCGFSSSIGEISEVTTLPAEPLESGFPPETHVGHYVTVGTGRLKESCRIDDLITIGDKCTGSLENHVVLGSWKFAL